MTNLARGAAALALLWTSGCSTPSATNPAEGGVSSPPSSVPSASPVSVSASASVPVSVSASVPASVPASASASAAVVEAAPPAAEEPIPDVKVTNIGMHIGGGKNDAPEKEPIRASVEPHFDAFKRCFAKLEDRSKGGDVSVDLRVEKDGGKAKLTKLKTALKGAAFEDCVKTTFEAIDFRRPKTGTTNVSYSLRFAPKTR